jgi:hypothetical protein
LPSLPSDTAFHPPGKGDGSQEGKDDLRTVGPFLEYGHDKEHANEEKYRIEENYSQDFYNKSHGNGPGPFPLEIRDRPAMLFQEIRMSTIQFLGGRTDIITIVGACTPPSAI